MKISESDNFMVVGALHRDRDPRKSHSERGEIINLTVNIMNLRCLCDILISRRQCSIEVCMQEKSLVGIERFESYQKRVEN